MTEVRSRRHRWVSVLAGVALVAGIVQLTSTARATFPGANGLIAYVSSGNVFVIDPTTLVPTQVTNTGNFTAVGYNASGTKLAGSTTAGLVTLDPVAGSAVAPIPNTTGGDSQPSFNPAGTKLVFHEQASATLVTIDTAGTNRTAIFTGGSIPDWSPDGTFIAFQGPADIARVDPNGGNNIVLATTGPAGAACTGSPCVVPSVSPDSKKVAFGQFGAGNGIAEVNADGTTLAPRRLTTAPAAASDIGPRYSPDGAQVLFGRFSGGTMALNRAPTDGSGTVTPVDSVTLSPFACCQPLSWGVKVGAVGTGTGSGTGSGVTFSVTGPAGKVKSGDCVFTVKASSAATGSVNFTTAVVSGKNAPSPASGSVAFANETSKTVNVSVKHSRRKHGDVSLTLTTATGGSVGSPVSATCDVGRK
jgi:hypothetical protein